MQLLQAESCNSRLWISLKMLNTFISYWVFGQYLSTLFKRKFTRYYLILKANIHSSCNINIMNNQKRSISDTYQWWSAIKSTFLIYPKSFFDHTVAHFAWVFCSNKLQYKRKSLFGVLGVAWRSRKLHVYALWWGCWWWCERLLL